MEPGVEGANLRGDSRNRMKGIPIQVAEKEERLALATDCLEGARTLRR